MKEHSFESRETDKTKEGIQVYAGARAEVLKSKGVGAEQGRLDNQVSTRNQRIRPRRTAGQGREPSR